MTRRIVIGVLIVVLLALGAVGVGLTAYQAGLAQGLVTSGQVLTAPDGVVNPQMFFWRGGPWGFGHGGFGWGGGFGFLRCLVPLFGFFLLFALFRLIIGPRRWGGGWGRRYWAGGPGGPGGPGPWGEHAVPPGFEEWHRRAHGEAAPPPPPAQQPPAEPGQ